MAHFVWHRAGQPLKPVARRRGNWGIQFAEDEDRFLKVHMLQRMAFAITVVPLGLGGGVLALFVRGMHAEWGAALGFCFVSVLAIVQACMVANGIAEAGRLNSNVRNACFRGTQAKFRDVFLLGLCAFVIVLPAALIGASSGAPARFATVMLGGMVFSTAAALTVLPVLIARIKE
jgi:cobalt-zinc-cadmium resistance protein CzcA